MLGDPRCPRCGKRMADGASGTHRICLNIGCPCFITLADGVVHFGRSAP